MHWRKLFTAEQLQQSLEEPIAPKGLDRRVEL